MRKKNKELDLSEGIHLQRAREKSWRDSFELVHWRFRMVSCGRHDKHLLTPDKKPMTDQSKEATRIQAGEPLSFRVTHRSIGEELLTRNDWKDSCVHTKSPRQHLGQLSKTGGLEHIHQLAGTQPVGEFLLVAQVGWASSRQLSLGVSFISPKLIHAWGGSSIVLGTSWSWAVYFQSSLSFPAG